MAKARRARSAEGDESSTLTEAVRQLTEEVRVLRIAVDEVRDDCVHALRNAEPLPKPFRLTSMPVDPCAENWEINRRMAADLPPEIRDGKPPQKIVVDAEQFARAMESVDQLSYCCDAPDLQWEGEPEAPGIQCRHCGYVVAEAGEIVDYRPPAERAEAAPTAAPAAPVADPPRATAQRELF